MVLSGLTSLLTRFLVDRVTEWEVSQASESQLRIAERDL